MKTNKNSAKNRSKFRNLGPFLILAICFILLISQSLSIEKVGIDIVLNNDRPKHTIINLNNWVYWQSYDGTSGSNPYSMDCGGIYPHGKANVVFQDGFVWGGYVQDHEESLFHGFFQNNVHPD